MVVRSYGIIPLKKEDGIWKILMIKHVNGGHWALPKGHGEVNESAKQTAVRELLEETGLSVAKFLKRWALVERYCLEPSVWKVVRYYLAEVEGEMKLQESEVSEARWVSLDEGGQLATYDPTREIIAKVERYLSSF